jgi:site-specific recombinase XerD
MKKGAGVRLVQSFLGHKKLTSTQVYTHVFKDDLKNVVEKYHPRG